MEPILEVKNVTKTFVQSKKRQKLEHNTSKIKVAVNDVSFEAYKGEIFGLLGPNGAGKTTMLRMLSSLIKQDSGEIVLDGINVKNSSSVYRNKIGFLTSELKLEEFFSTDYLFDFFGKLHGLSEESIKERKKYLFEQFGIDEFKDVKIHDLSTGMKQKASLAISIVHDPEFIIFDEPTNGLDIITAKIVTDFLEDLRNKGKTIILSTHIFSLVEKVCDRVGIIVEGKLIACDYLKNIIGDNKDLEEAFFKLYEVARS